MTMCACATCQNMDDLHGSNVAKRRKIISTFDAKLELMSKNSRETRSSKQERDFLAKELATYKDSTFVVEKNKITRPLHDKGWDACEQYGCGERRSIKGNSYRFLPWRCKKGDCVRCREKGYAPPAFEARKDLEDEIIKYSVFESKAMCMVPGHGGHHIQKFDDKPKLRCTGCEAMEEKEPGWKKRHNSKVVERKSRQVFHAKWREFTGPEGAYTQAMKKMLSHKQDVILLGKKMNSDPRHEYVRSRKGKAVLLTRDFMERMGISANNQMQFEYFNSFAWK